MRFVVLVPVLLTPAVALAQTAAETFAGTAWDVLGWLLVMGVGGLVVAGLGWLMSWGVGKLKGSDSPELVKDLVANFVETLKMGLSGAVLELQEEFAKARDPNSPGGERITQAELHTIGVNFKAWLLDQYGSWDAISKLVANVTGGVASPQAAEKFIDKFVASNAEAAAGKVNPSTPAR